MKLMSLKLCFGLIFSLLAAGGTLAQAKKTASAQKPAGKKPAVVAKKAVSKLRDARKTPDRKQTANRAKTSARNTKAVAAKTAPAKSTGKSRANQKKAAGDVAEKNARSKPETRKEAAERKRKEAERRAAILAEQRRREQARREAIARQIAFEKGLRTETEVNIAKDVTEGEDLAIRQAAVNALGTRAGSVVVMEAQTGKILTIVNQDWAVRSGVKPCSTIKLVTGVAALNENVLNREDGSMVTASSKLNLDDALAFSNNGFFQRAGATIGNAKMIEYARKLGLGEPTGLATEGEYAGKLPYGNNNPRIYSHGDDFEVTGLQLAVMVSAIANGGNRLLPRVPRNSVEKANFQTFYRSRVELPQQSVRRVIPGMIGAAEYGTAHRGVDAELGIAGKTGSCISKGSWVGLFASVAPIEKPKYSVVVITRGQRERGKYAAAVAGQVYRALASQIVRTDRNLAQTEFKLKPRATEAGTAVATADEDEEDDAAGATDAAAGNVVALPLVRPRVVEDKTNPKKLVTKTSDSKPVFPPVVITYDRKQNEKKPVPIKKP